ncbi:hypothetical protein TNCV_4056821 [Trichonephila clavipes]|nr:hypothetical protein TNCV_4056821 [Trichonephila clavipes]
MVIWNAPYHKQPRRLACYPHGLNGSCKHITSPESRIVFVCKTTSLYTNVQRCLQQHGLSAQRPWLRLPLTVLNGVINDEPFGMNGESHFFR